jgi:hypothetical protein
MSANRSFGVYGNADGTPGVVIRLFWSGLHLTAAFTPKEDGKVSITASINYGLREVSQ